MSLQIQKLVPEAKLPYRTTPGSAGYDLFAYTECVVEPGRRAVVPLGFSVTMPEGLYGVISPKTGLAVKHGLVVLGGTIDPDYEGEVKVILYNTDRYPFVIHPGFRIAQLVLVRYETPELEEQEDLSTQDAEKYYKVCGV
jgi:dUTP pyrophosphatase